MTAARWSAEGSSSSRTDGPGASRMLLGRLGLQGRRRLDGLALLQAVLGEEDVVARVVLDRHDPVLVDRPPGLPAVGLRRERVLVREPLERALHDPGDAE